MKDFAGRFAVVTGGGTGMGRELARQLIGAGLQCDGLAQRAAGLRQRDAHRLPVRDGAQGVLAKWVFSPFALVTFIWGRK